MFIAAVFTTADARNMCTNLKSIREFQLGRGRSVLYPSYGGNYITYLCLLEFTELYTKIFLS